MHRWILATYALVIYGDSGSLCEANPNASFVQKIFHVTK
jgi:hypothetical protein